MRIGESAASRRQAVRLVLLPPKSGTERRSSRASQLVSDVLEGSLESNQVRQHEGQTATRAIVAG